MKHSQQETFEKLLQLLTNSTLARQIKKLIWCFAILRRRRAIFVFFFLQWVQKQVFLHSRKPDKENRPTCSVIGWQNEARRQKSFLERNTQEKNNLWYFPYTCVQISFIEFIEKHRSSPPSKNIISDIAELICVTCDMKFRLNTKGTQFT